MAKKINRVPLDASIHWRYLHQDAGKTYSDEIILKVFKRNHLQAYEEEYWRLGGRFVKNNQGRPPKPSVRQKRNILRQTKLLQEEMGNFCVKRVMVKAGIPPSISEETVRRVLRKAGLKWARV